MEGAPTIVTRKRNQHRWTMAELQRLGAQWRDGVNGKVIAHQAGISMHQLYHLARQHRALFPDRKLGWTEAEIAEASARWARGHTAADIAEYFERKPRDVRAMVCHHRDRFPYRYSVGPRRLPGEATPGAAP